MVTTATRVGPSPHFLAGLGSSFSSSSLSGMRKPAVLVPMKAVEEKMIGMKRKRERDSWEEDEEELQQDPLEVFGSDIMMMILSHLDARSVALSLLVSRAWHGVASSDRLWTSKCEELWHGKAHIPRMSQMRGLSKLAAYSISVMDGKRARITRDDLCDHAWYFHFNMTIIVNMPVDKSTKEAAEPEEFDKIVDVRSIIRLKNKGELTSNSLSNQAAPEYWLNLDPSWKGTGPPMRRYFHPDGSQTADQDDKVWGGHESCYSVVTGIVGESKIRSHYVRINRWPSMVVARKDDWSWGMSNHLYSYSSIPDADKEGGTGPY